MPSEGQGIFLAMAVVVRFKMVSYICVGLLLCLPAFVPAVLSQTLATFSTDELDALQSLWAAWNESTPNTNVSLAGWKSSGGQAFYPCNTNIDIKWRGVTCLQHQENGTSVSWIIGLTLSDASIGGILPPDIGKLHNLVTLVLTGNANLTGPLPVELGELSSLNILDLHDNGFSGVIPTEVSQDRYILQLDLSGNRFVGQFPTQYITKTKSQMQVFKISGNLLEGDIPLLAFENMTQLLTVDLSSNRFTGLPPNFSFIPNLNYLNLSSNLFTGLAPLSSSLSSMFPQNLEVLDLSGLSIGGDVPSMEFMGFSTLQYLYLDGNNFTGVLNISTLFMKSLKELSLKANNIRDVIYSDASMGMQQKIFLQGNPYCQDSTSQDDGRRCYCEQNCFVSPRINKNETRKVAVIISACSAAILTLVILVFSFVLQRNRKRMRSLYEALESSEVNAKKFEYRELRAATRNFSPAMKLGAGAFGAVYKGVLPNKTEVAVKQLFLKTKEGRDDFINEVLLISNLQHRNLVTLKGYSLHDKEMLLVYEYVENSDLYKLLLSSQISAAKLQKLMNWQVRMNICLGVAQGLYYLHASSQSRILHRDIKASNILLDKNLNPKIGDFGLARPIQDEQSKIITERCAGTLAYLAPEYVFFGRLSEKADVFSFGVLLLEILSGRRNRLAIPGEDDGYLPIYAWRLQSEGNVLDLVDPRLQLEPSNMSEVHRVLSTAILCVHTAPEKRPSMFRVLAMLTGDADAARPEPGQSNVWSDFLTSPFTEHSSSPPESSTVTNDGHTTVELFEVSSTLIERSIFT